MTGPVIVEDFSGVPNGATVNLSNTGLSLVSFSGTAGAAVGDSSHLIHNVNSVHVTGGATDVAELGLYDPVGGATSISAHIYIKFNTLPTLATTVQLLSLRGAGGNPVSLAKFGLTTANKFCILDAAGAVTVKTFATTVVTGQLYRLELSAAMAATTTTGTIKGNYYLDEATTEPAGETAYSSSTQNAGTFTNQGTAVGVWGGKPNSLGILDVQIAHLAIQAGTTAEIGPAPAAALQLLKPGPARVVVISEIAPQASGVVSASAVTGPPVVRVLSAAPTVTGYTTADVSATVEADHTPPRVRLDVGTALGPSILITRTVAGSAPVAVRQANPAPLAGGTAVVYDYEAPFNQPVTYTFAGYGAVDPVIVPASQPWLIHPGVPSLSMPVTVRLLDDETTSGNVGAFNVPGRKYPLVVTSGQRFAPVSSLQVKTTTTTERLALDQLLADTSPLLLQVVYPFTGESDYKWIAVTDIQRARRSSNNYADAARYWTCAYVEVEAPVGPVQAQRTYASGVAESVTYADNLLMFPTYRERLTGIAGT